MCNFTLNWYKNNLLSRISIDPNICFGKPCIKGHRIWVSLILDLLASGEKIETILEEYPGLEREDILACIAYAAEITRDSYVENSIRKYSRISGY
ncbi:DUF433 domain-containing protein [Nostoc sp. ChiSLP03a]|uniref:DUF433 domain-containing protein n=1 Tax=Nostoc sp. ChiSLP03a TaxID=3075380 RepID=UPI002AD262D0|nr:DUF433 domain-containing protein [Nostoc sp. ChiSLP03a]MDZ8214770.1 DUF433 domain-containing protein [Nostoc sp. ChiSLP03a]